MTDTKTLEQLWADSKGQPVFAKNVKTNKIDRISYRSSVGNFTGKKGMYAGFHKEWVLAPLEEVEANQMRA